jgi:hypothetical protein
MHVISLLASILAADFCTGSVELYRPWLGFKSHNLHVDRKREVQKPTQSNLLVSAQVWQELDFANKHHLSEEVN